MGIDMITTATTAAEAFELYTAAMHADSLVQSAWHKEQDGRQLACGLGVLGPDIDAPSKCPAAIMPRWLAQMVPWFFDKQEVVDAIVWGEKFYAELKRLDGKVPFTVVHDWHAHVIGPLALETAALRKTADDVHRAVIDLHERALSGDVATVDKWRETLRPAYAYAYAYADANADAYAYRKNITRLAHGMVECLARVQAQ